jgi:hypothetical protein
MRGLRVRIKDLHHVRELPHMLAKRQGIAPAPAPWSQSAPQQQSPLEVMFAALWEDHGNDMEPVPEYTFGKSMGRRWRFDFAWPALKVAVECDGGQHSSYGGGRHNTDADREKLNAAAAMGWRVLRFSRTQLEDEPEQCIGVVLLALEYEPDSKRGEA